MAISFDPTASNPARRNRRGFVPDDDGGIGGVLSAANAPAPKVAASANPPASADDGGIPATPPATPTGSAPALAGWAPANETGLAGIHALSAWLRSDPASRAAAARAQQAKNGTNVGASTSSAPSGDTPQASGNAGGLPATPPSTPSIPKLTPIFGAATPLPLDVRSVNPQGGLAAQPSYETGVTLPDGRKLPIGAMVKGVPTFSDGSGGIGGAPGSIPRTMPDAEIKGLGAQLPTVPAGTVPVGFASPAAFNSYNSDANIADILRSRQGGKFGVTPEMDASADLTSVLNQDPRSTLGLAALNASRRAGAASTTLQRKSALDALSGIDEGAVRNYLATTSGVNSLADINAQGGNALQREKVAEQLALSAQEARREQQLQNTNLAGQYRLQAAQMRTAPKPTTAKDQVSLALNLWQKAPQLLGLDPMGNIIDPTTGKSRAPTPQERSALWSRALQMAGTAAGADTQGLGAAPPAAATPTGAAGSSRANPVDAATLTHAPNAGTWIKLPDGSVKQYTGQGSANG